MKEGYYRVKFLGREGLGFGLVSLDHDRVVGCDSEGGHFDGEFQYDSRTDLVAIQVTYTAPYDGLEIVQGVTLNKGDQYQASVSFPKNADDTIAVADTTFGKVEVSLTLIRQFVD